MWCQIGGARCPSGPIVDDRAGCPGIEAPPSHAEHQSRAAERSNERWAPLAEPALQGLFRGSAIGNAPLTIALADDAQQPAAGVDVAEIQATELRDAHRRRVKQLDDEPIAHGDGTSDRVLRT